MEFDKDMLTFMLGNISRQLAMIDLAQLQDHVREANEQVYRMEAFAPVLAPGEYFGAMNSGKLDDAKYQAQIAGHLLKALEVIHQREAFVAALQARNKNKTDEE